MHDERVFREAIRLLDNGQNAHQVATKLGVPWGTVRYWRAGGRSLTRRVSYNLCRPGDCPWLPPRSGAAYIYLLGLYLGDGTIQKVGRSVQLRVFLDDRYLGIQDECAAAISSVTNGGVVSRVQRVGCTVIGSYSLHWRCLFPQYGAGRKHLRTIELADWQQLLADEYPERLLRGLIHSDGCRDLNKTKGHEYPRYSFSNRSDDIHAIFQRTACRLGIRYTTKQFVTSIARRPDVARMDEIIGAKY